jgi:hypothetical protein
MNAFRSPSGKQLKCDSIVINNTLCSHKKINLSITGQDMLNTNKKNDFGDKASNMFVLI